MPGSGTKPFRLLSYRKTILLRSKFIRPPTVTSLHLVNEDNCIFRNMFVPSKIVKPVMSASFCLDVAIIPLCSSVINASMNWF